MEAHMGITTLPSDCYKLLSNDVRKFESKHHCHVDHKHLLAMSEPVGKLEEEALRRKERLRNLVKKSPVQKDDQFNDSGASLESPCIPKPVFRNYKSVSAEINDHDVGSVGDVQSEVKVQLDMMKTAIVIEDIDIVNLAPRKPDWDLKRDVSKKLEKLERRTQKAIAELIRERLIAGQSQDILQTVNIATSTAYIDGRSRGGWTNGVE